MHGQSNLSRSLPPTPSQLHPSQHDQELPPEDYFAEADEVPLPFPIKTIVADPQTGLSLTLISALGAGSYAVVYLAQEVASGSLYALKCLGKDKLTEEEVAIQRNEVVIHTSLPRHRNIIHLFNMFETTHHLFLLLEYSSGMDMYQWISMRSDRSDLVSGALHPPATRFAVIKTVFDQVLEGVSQVHSCGVAHRDLKPENFLVEATDGVWTVKITDFGLATTDVESDEFECGSKPYMSFECRNGVHTPYNVQKSDLWSLGIILINLLYHRCPWSDPCPQESYAFASFLKHRVDFLQRRFEDMPGPVARWLGLRAFAFAESGMKTKRRSRPSMEEWKTWMVEFVPRMLGQALSDSEEDLLDGDSEADEEEEEGQEYQKYVFGSEDDLAGQEILGEEIIDDEDEDDEDDKDHVVPINIQPTSLQHSHLLQQSGRAYASFEPQPGVRAPQYLHSTSMPKFDPSAFYQPTRLRQESWSDAIDMEGTEDAQMDFSAPILFEESEEDEACTRGSDEDDGDSLGLAMALPDDFIDPLPEPSRSADRLTPSTPPLSHLTFNSEKRQRPPNLRFDVDTFNQKVSNDSSKRSLDRASPGAEALDQINTLVFIEPNTTLDTAQYTTSSTQPHASSLPSSNRIAHSAEGTVSIPDKDPTRIKHQMKKPTRNLQDVKAAPFVFPPLKTPTSSTFSSEAASSRIPGQNDRAVVTDAPTRNELTETGPKGATSKSGTQNTGIYVPKRSLLGPTSRPTADTFTRSTGQESRTHTSTPLLPGPPRVPSRHPASPSTNWRKGHHRGSSWTSMDDVWDSHRGIARRHEPITSGGRSPRVPHRTDDRDGGHAGLPPRVENKFRPRFRQSRRIPLTHTRATAALPPTPPVLGNGSSSGFGPGRSRHQSRTGAVFDHVTPVPVQLPGSGDFWKSGAKEGHGGRDTGHLPHAPKYEHSQLRFIPKPLSESSTRLSGQRNRSLVDLRTLDASSPSWRQPQGNADSQAVVGGATRPRALPDDKPHPVNRQSIHPLDTVTGSAGYRNRLSDRGVLNDAESSKDNVYHPPHWYEKKAGSSISVADQRKASSGLEMDSGPRQDHGTLGVSPLKNRGGFKGQPPAEAAPNTVSLAAVSSPLDRKPKPADIAPNWRGGGNVQALVRPQDPTQPLSKKSSARTLHPKEFSGGLTVSDSGPFESPSMVLTPPTPSATTIPELSVRPANGVAADWMTETEPGRVESGSKKVVQPGTMAGLGTMLRGLVAYNKNIKVAGELCEDGPQTVNPKTPSTSPGTD